MMSEGSVKMLLCVLISGYFHSNFDSYVEVILVLLSILLLYLAIRYFVLIEYYTPKLLICEQAKKVISNCTTQQTSKLISSEQFRKFEANKMSRYHKNRTSQEKINEEDDFLKEWAEKESQIFDD